LEESKTRVTFAAVHDKNDKTYKTHKETVPHQERLRSVLYDKIYSRPFLSGKAFLFFITLKLKNKPK
jgi:hypothetical protein